MTTTSSCDSCGMPIESGRYCGYCTDESGALQSFDERFARMWEFYLAASEATFRHDDLVVFQLQLAKKLNTLPVTRTYMER